GGIIMPGLINTHTHAAMTCFRGLADDLQLMSWLNDHIFPAEAKLDEQKVYSGTLLACAEMIMSGTTCFCDMYLFEDAVARAADDAGMRAVVGEVLYDFDSPNYGPIAQGFEYTRKLIDKWQKHPRVNIAVEPHSTYLCAPELLQEAFDLAQDFKLPLVIHLAESKSEVAQIKERFDRTPVEHLAELGLLAPNVVACHCVESTENDIALLKRYDVKVAHNAESNMKLASGVAPIPRLLDEGICVGLGTDGCASNNNLDLFLEMDTVAKLHKAKTLDPTVMDAQTVLKMATLKGAQVLGLESIIGSLETGKKADLIIVDTARPHLTPMYNPVSHMVYAARGSDVTTVIIDGTIVLEDGQLKTMNLESVLNDVNIIAQEIRGKK
ncbi:MAG: amidohydrolase, partial [Desulfobacterales bacterium]